LAASTGYAARRRSWPGEECVLNPSPNPSNLDFSFEERLARLLAESQGRSLLGDEALPIYDVLRYHLGQLDERLQPIGGTAGKRVRPKLCLTCCAAAGGDPNKAIPVALAIELLHNFTLIHDDIQDQSQLRRHRPTVWARWGTAQAINAGDAMFVLAHLALNQTTELGIPAETTLRLSAGLHETTLRIVEGQVLDLGFEERASVTVAEYLTMIKGKTAALLRHACWAGAVVAGASPDHSLAYGDFGEALGLAFQIRDDELGVWGDAATTGKTAADDLRRRKKALPLLLLIERAEARDREAIAWMMSGKSELAEDDVRTLLALMDHYEVREGVAQEGSRWQARAAKLLQQTNPAQPAASTLETLLAELAARSS
jgi:geranylgeranyl diphosphate synthase type I